MPAARATIGCADFRFMPFLTPLMADRIPIDFIYWNLGDWYDLENKDRLPLRLAVGEAIFHSGCRNTNTLRGRRVLVHDIGIIGDFIITLG